MDVYKKEIHLRLRFSVHVAIFVQRYLDTFYFDKKDTRNQVWLWAN